MKFVAYIIFRVFVWLFSLIPFSFLYIISDILRFVLQNVFKYRTGVIEKNIKFCFSKWPSIKLKSTANAFYKNFIDISLESLKGISTTPKKIIPRYKLTNPELLNDYYNNDQSIILLSQHFNNWEWGPICLGLQIKHHVVGVIKKLSNPYIHKYFAEGRAGNNVSVITTGQTQDYIITHSPKKPEALVFIADQYPYNQHRRIEASFFNKRISFHAGAGTLSAKTTYPIFSIDVIRKGRGEYTLEIHKLADENHGLSGSEIINKYAEHLEALIREYPDAWLWSHKRFKDDIKY